MWNAVKVGGKWYYHDISYIGTSSQSYSLFGSNSPENSGRTLDKGYSMKSISRNRYK